MSDFTLSELGKQMSLKPNGRIVWLLDEKEVGSAPLPDATSGYCRLELAELNGIEKYNNFLFTNNYGIIRINANDNMIDGEKMGEKSGKDYDTFKKRHDKLLINK